MDNPLDTEARPARTTRALRGCLSLVAVLVVLTFGLWLVQPRPVVRPQSNAAWEALPIDPQLVLGGAFSADRKLLAIHQSDDTVQIWRLADRTRLQTLPTADTAVENLLFSPDGQLLAIGQRGDGVRVWRVADGTLLHVFSKEFGYPRDITFSPDSHLLAAAIDGNKKAIMLWQVADGSLLRDIPVDAQPTAVRFSPDGARLAVGFQDSRSGWVGLWSVNATDQKPERSFDFGEWAFVVAFSPDGRFLAASGGGYGQDSFLPLPKFLRSHATIRIWDLDNRWLNWPAQTLSGPQEDISYLTFSADSRRLISDGDQQVVEFQVAPYYVPWWWPVPVLALVAVIVWRVRARRTRPTR